MNVDRQIKHPTPTILLLRRSLGKSSSQASRGIAVVSYFSGSSFLVLQRDRCERASERVIGGDRGKRQQLCLLVMGCGLGPGTCSRVHSDTKDTFTSQLIFATTGSATMWISRWMAQCIRVCLTSSTTAAPVSSGMFPSALSVLWSTSRWVKITKPCSQP